MLLTWLTRVSIVWGILQFAFVPGFQVSGANLVDPATTSETSDSPNGNATKPEDVDTSSKLSAAVARQLAAILHETIHSTLRVTHDRYYVEDEGLPIPASVLKEVFADIKETQNITLRWLAVEAQAMNTDHKPQDDFELQAVKALKSGTKLYEEAKPGVYRRVGSITLTNHCLKCHVPDRKSVRNHTAGLIISVPIGQ